MVNYSPRLPTSTIPAAFQFEPDEAFWATIVEHTGPLSPAVRESLDVAVQRYIASAQHEVNATELGVAKKRLREISVAARRFLNVLGGSPVNDAWHHVEGLINDGLRERMRFRIVAEGLNDTADGPVTVHMFWEVMQDFTAACQAAKTELKDSASKKFYPPGEAWNAVVSALADVYESYSGLDASARKDTDAFERFSPFVQFVHLVQCQLPDRFRQHLAGRKTKTPGKTLSRAVDKVLAARRGAGLKAGI